MQQKKKKSREGDVPLAVVLAGGLGTRLRPLTESIPKALIPVQGKPLTEHVLDILRSHGVTEAILALCYRADQVSDYFGDGSRFGMSIGYIIEEQPRGTAGFLSLLKQKERTLLVLNGDVLSEIDITGLLRYHREMRASHGAVASIALTEVEDPSRFGVAALEGERIARFVEKPRPEEAPSRWISSGYYVLSPEIFSYLPKKEHVMFEQDIFPRLASDGKLFGFKERGQWFDTGTWESYRLVEREWKGVQEKEGVR